MRSLTTQKQRNRRGLACPSGPCTRRVPHLGEFDVFIVLRVKWNQ